MSKIGDELIEAMTEAVTYAQGAAAARFHLPPGAIDVRRIRDKLGLSQAVFAARFGFSAAAVQDWEQGRRRPEAAARTLLLVIDRSPEVVVEALHAAE
jgi:putative transcriptional regulator